MGSSKIRLMEVCGTHTMAIARFGIKKLLPSKVELISGPGCPVCVTHQTDIDIAVKIAGLGDVIMVTFGDMMRVPGSGSSFQDLKAKGADIRIVYSPLDALAVAQANINKSVVFMGVGFETTAPTVAATIIEAKRRRIKNFFVLANFKLLFPALGIIAESRELNIDGFICPGHVSVITGSRAYSQVAAKSRKPCVITGFEDSDIIKGINRLLVQVKKGLCKVEIEYKRAVTKSGNSTAKEAIKEVFSPCDSSWRGLGLIKKSGLKIRKKYASFDAQIKFRVKVAPFKEPKGCLCGKIIQGLKVPLECKLFKKLCTPARPVGPCMVSSEGACAAYYKYGS